MPPNRDRAGRTGPGTGRSRRSPMSSITSRRRRTGDLPPHRRIRVGRSRRPSANDDIHSVAIAATTRTAEARSRPSFAGRPVPRRTIVPRRLRARGFVLPLAKGEFGRVILAASRPGRCGTICRATAAPTSQGRQSTPRPIRTQCVLAPLAIRMTASMASVSTAGLGPSFPIRLSPIGGGSGADHQARSAALRGQRYDGGDRAIAAGSHGAPRNPGRVLPPELLQRLVQAEHEPLPRRERRRDRTGDYRLRSRRLHRLVVADPPPPTRWDDGPCPTEIPVPGSERRHRQRLRLGRAETPALRSRPRSSASAPSPPAATTSSCNDTSCTDRGRRRATATGGRSRPTSRRSGSAPPARPTPGPPSPRRTAPGRRSTPRTPAPSGPAGSARSRPTSGSRPSGPPSNSASAPSPALPTTRSSKPPPEPNAKAASGSTPPEAIVLVTGSGPSKPEISVRSFDPALTVTRSGWPLKLPTKRRAPGSLPTE